MPPHIGSWQVISFFLGHLSSRIDCFGGTRCQKSHLHLSIARQNLKSWQYDLHWIFWSRSNLLQRIQWRLVYTIYMTTLTPHLTNVKKSIRGANFKYWKPTESPAASCTQMLGILQDFRSEYGWGGDEKVAEDLGGGEGVLGLQLWVGWGGLGVGGGGGLTEIRSEG